MGSIFFGAEEFTKDDSAYDGSLFSTVRDAVFANPYQEVWGVENNSPFPVYRVTLASVLHGLFPDLARWSFARATERIVDSSADLRWGPDGKGYRRLLHPNGICLIGTWEITTDADYSGYFAPMKKGLVIARYSTCCSETRRGRTRSLSLVGKLFPTTDKGHKGRLRTASFITQQDIGGYNSDYINDAELLNAPNTTALRRGCGVPVLLVTGAVFGRVDKKPSIRQLYEIAELGKSAEERTRAPTYMRLIAASAQPRIHGEDMDFRDEVMAQIYDKGDPAPKRTITFHIETTDCGSSHGLPIRERRVLRHWRRVGRLTFSEAVASYNGDFVIHFHHPTWRDDQNDPTTATRVDGKKLR